MFPDQGTYIYFFRSPQSTTKVIFSLLFNPLGMTTEKILKQRAQIGARFWTRFDLYETVFDHDNYFITG